MKLLTCAGLRPHTGFRTETRLEPNPTALSKGISAERLDLTRCRTGGFDLVDHVRGMWQVYNTA